MKQTIKSLMMGAMMMALPFLFTSCEDILGHWEKPTPATPTVEEMLTNLSSALEEGALVTITYTVDGVTYTSTFKKVGDEYVEQSTTSASRALTRASSNILAQLHEFQKTINFQVVKDNKVVLNVEINSNDGTYAETFGDGAELKGAAVNGISAFIINKCKKTITIRPEGGGAGGASINYIDGDTWRNFYERQSKNGHMIVQIINEKVLLSNDYTWQLYKDADYNNPVLPDDEISDDVYYKVSTENYQAASWNGTSVAYEDPAPSTSQYTLVSPSMGSVTWGEGTYVVKSNVTIGDDQKLNGYITLKGNVNLILCDGAKLTVNGEIHGDGNSLTIYCQSENTGSLDVVSDDHGIQKFSNLTIHGGNNKVYSIGGGISKSTITVYGGKISVTSFLFAIDTGAGNDMTVYGGEIEAICILETGIYLDNGNGTLTAYGGKVTAQGGEHAGTQYPAIEGYFKAGTGTRIGFFGRNDNVSWTKITNTPTTATTSEFKYFHAGDEAPIE